MKKSVRLFTLLMVVALLTSAFSVVSFADDAVGEEYVTVPFEVPDGVGTETPVKPAIEDIASRFLTIDSALESAISARTLKALKTGFNKHYQKVAEFFNYGIIFTVSYTRDDSTDVAYATNGKNALDKRIGMNAPYYKNSTDVGSLTHELTHTVQLYKNSKYGDPKTKEGGSWICEGITDWSRYTFDSGSFDLPNFSSSQSYLDSYRTTARFFQWINFKIDPTFMEQFNEGLKCEAYTSNLFVKITGKTVDELWSLYAASDHKIK